jgi:hypothetical protein
MSHRSYSNRSIYREGYTQVLFISWARVGRAAEKRITLLLLHTKELAFNLKVYMPSTNSDIAAKASGSSALILLAI